MIACCRERRREVQKREEEEEEVVASRQDQKAGDPPLLVLARSGCFLANYLARLGSIPLSDLADRSKNRKDSGLEEWPICSHVKLLWLVVYTEAATVTTATDIHLATTHMAINNIH